MNVKSIRGIYVHIPFCVQKCDYCAFYSLVSDKSLREAYTKRLCREIKERASYNYREEIALKTLYFGGGTPSVLEPEYLCQIVDALHTHFDLNSVAEQTIELNPESVTFEKLKVYRNLGFNRVSLGVQSLDNELLKRLHRVHDAREALSALEKIEAAGFENVSVDIMYNLPGQTTSQLESSLEKLYRNFSPPHLSAYALVREEGTPLYEKYRENSDELEAEMAELLLAFTRSQGLSRYEISNYAKDGFYSRHNSLYWNMDSYFGFGAGASSFLSGERRVNADILNYISASAPVYQEIVPEEDRLLKEEMLFTGLRQIKGIKESDYYKLFETTLENDYGETLERLRRRGLIERENGRLFLTERGLDLSNQVFLEFIEI